ncbi:uncharacterized protein JCM6883_001725 [Sporobolomyces salmoneus]|uniref:uncharacterized protein n=1 Tax=Sporobolomyces salmoneus TaxID=183962 RepID=UPI00316F1091
MRAEEGFQQPPLEIPLAWSSDSALQALIERILPPRIFQRVEAEFKGFEQRLAGPIRKLSRRIDLDPHSIEPTLIQYDQWGRRTDELVTSESWRELKKVAIEEGLVEIAMKRKEGEFSRVRGFAKGYLFAPDGLYVGCPISMTDGAARVLELAGTEQMKKEILPRLMSLDPREAYIAGQWMTERPSGSDLALTETIARPVDPSHTSPGSEWILDGFKWFSSATDGDVALALARTEDQGSGSRGLSLFLIELRDSQGQTNGVFVHRLKKKFGTKALPTAELSIENCRAQLVGPLGAGVRTISTVLNITRLHSAMSCVASLRRCLVLAKSFSQVRHIGGDLSRLLANNSMHTNALVKSELTHRALLHLVFGTIHLLGRSEALGSEGIEEGEKWRLRLLTPVVKSFAAELSTTEMPDLMASLGGQGYMVENQFARLIADANVERIWEGTTSVLSLDVARVILQSKGAAIKAFIEWAHSVLAKSKGLQPVVDVTHQRLRLLQQTTERYFMKQPDPRLSRPLLFLLGWIASTIYLVEQATWSTEMGRPEADLDRWVVERWTENGGAIELE